MLLEEPFNTCFNLYLLAITGHFRHLDGVVPDRASQSLKQYFCGQIVVSLYLKEQTNHFFHHQIQNYRRE